MRARSRPVHTWYWSGAMPTNCAGQPSACRPRGQRRSTPWHAATRRHPVGSEVTAEITDVFPTTREYFVAFDGLWSALFWTGTPPIVGTTAQFIADRHLDATRRIRLRTA
ncbi:hypothetical protein IRT45_12860 [Nocardia sp. BSTN01]|uniref:hypothetical protein n=1 Tax=Nocardia sp. BSTN01 TaxID=2783665 RepID=UPI001890903A|nr:hypothetical protein [Nocardia sp. BSTN01]MBF4998041.1 hypothetical protein [Nocardia sp. BSTN01]